MTERPNHITPAGYAKLRAEYEQLFAHDRPALVETISWAAGNGDRSENGDYIYGRKKLREIDRRLGWLSRRMKAAKVVDPAAQADRTRVWFGCTVTIADEDDQQRVDIGLANIAGFFQRGGPFIGQRLVGGACIVFVSHQVSSLSNWGSSVFNAERWVQALARPDCLCANPV